VKTWMPLTLLSSCPSLTFCTALCVLRHSFVSWCHGVSVDPFSAVAMLFITCPFGFRWGRKAVESIKCHEKSPFSCRRDLMSQSWIAYLLKYIFIFICSCRIGWNVGEREKKLDLWHFSSKTLMETFFLQIQVRIGPTPALLPLQRAASKSI